MILKRRNLFLEKRTMGLLPRLRILIRRLSCTSDSFQENTSFFPTRTKFFCQKPFNGVFFLKETLLSSQDDIYLRKKLWVFSQG